MNEPELSIGAIFVDVKPPRREWRIARRDANSLVLERVDKPTVLRFLAPAELRDPLRYARKA